VFEENNLDADKQTSVEDQEQMERESLASSQFWPFDEIFNEENTENFAEDDAENRTYEEERYPSSSAEAVRSNKTTDGVDSSLLLMKRYEDLVRSMELQQERIVTLEKKVTNPNSQESLLSRNDAVVCQESQRQQKQQQQQQEQQQQQLETDLTQAKMKQLDLEKTLRDEEKEYERVVASNQAGHQSDLIMESVIGRGGDEPEATSATPRAAKKFRWWG